MKFNQAKYAVVNTLGTLGYLSVLLQWTWCLITLGQPLFTMENPLFLPQAPIPEMNTPIDFGSFTPIVLVMALFFTLLLMLLTAITLIRLPKTVGKKGSKVTKSIATSIIKQTHHHQPIPIKQRVRLTYKITWLVKIVAVYTPLGLVFVTPPVGGLTTELIATIGFVCALCSSVYFVMQIALSWFFKLDRKKIW